MVQAGGDEEFFKEAINENPATPAFFINPVNAPIPWVINGQIQVKAMA
jgi:hypothetical protein